MVVRKLNWLNGSFDIKWSFSGYRIFSRKNWIFRNSLKYAFSVVITLFINMSKSILFQNRSFLHLPYRPRIYWTCQCCKYSCWFTHFNAFMMGFIGFWFLSELMQVAQMFCGIESIQLTIQKPNCIVITKNSIIKKPSPHQNENFSYPSDFIQCFIFIPNAHDKRNRKIMNTVKICSL